MWDYLDVNVACREDEVMQDEKIFRPGARAHP